MTNWNNLSYQTITSASIKGDILHVEFANNDSVTVELSQILSPEDILSTEENEDSQISFSSSEVIFGDPEFGELTVPWDKIRVLTDVEFSKAMARKAEEQAGKIGMKIKRLRERQGIKSIELAERSGISPQTISRIEKGHQDVSFITLRKLLAAMGYTLQDLADEDARLTELAEAKSLPMLLKRVSRAGVDPKFLTKKIIPSFLQGALFDLHRGTPELLIDEATDYVSKVYGWTMNEIWGEKNLEIQGKYATLPLFKKGTRANYNLIRAYLPYAEFIANAAMKAANIKAVNPIPDSIEEFKERLAEFGGLTLKALLDYTWSMGILVMPLNDAGTFHGAAWQVEGRKVIILKQKNQSHAKWLFDLLHEILHVFNHVKDGSEIVVEFSEINPYSSDDEQEREANTFANEIVLNGKAEDYVREIVKISGGKVEYLQNAVKDFAESHNLRADSLANYLAYRLDAQGRNWWGAAESLQQKEPEPFEVARDVFLSNVSMEKLNPIEYNLLSTALNINPVNYESSN